MIDDFPEIRVTNFEDFPSLPFETVGEPLDKLLKSMINLVEREWPQQYSGNVQLKLLLLGFIRITQNTYESIRYLCADTPADEGRKLEFSVSVPPLARTILDTLCTIIFLFDDVQQRISWYHKSGWRETCEEYIRYKNAYGGDPQWTEYLSMLEALTKYGQRVREITDEEARNPKKYIHWWPNPGTMARHYNTSQDRKTFLLYLNDWFYRNLSSDSHLSWSGYARRFAPFIDADEKDRINRLMKYKSDCVMTTISLVLALLSEVECEMRFDLSVRLKYVWGILSNFYGEAKELYELRYLNKL